MARRKPINRKKFLTDLELGKSAEKYIAKLYKDNFFTTAEYMFNATKAYDICFLFPRKKRVRLEVKYDKYANKSGNLCFELFNHEGEPSGILGTEADIMVFMLTKTLIFEFSVPELREFIQKHMITGEHKIVKGGDGNAFEMMLVPIDVMKKQSFCKRIVVK